VPLFAFAQKARAWRQAHGPQYRIAAREPPRFADTASLRIVASAVAQMPSQSVPIDYVMRWQFEQRLPRIACARELRREPRAQRCPPDCAVRSGDLLAGDNPGLPGYGSSQHSGAACNGFASMARKPEVFCLIGIPRRNGTAAPAAKVSTGWRGDDKHQGIPKGASYVLAT
jgi:hypothetical protein